MILPPEVIEYHVLPHADIVTLFRAAATSTVMHDMVRRHVESQVAAHARVVYSMRDLSRITARDRSGRFRNVFDGV